MAKAKEAQILAFSIPNKPGQLAAVADLIAQAGVNVKAILAQESGSQAEFRILTAKNAKVRKALGPLNVEVREEPVIWVELPNKAGSLEKIARKIAGASVNITRTWAASFKGKTSTLVMQTSDDKKALEAMAGKNK